MGSFHGSPDLDTFRKVAWAPEIPLHIRDFHRLPAMKRWFQYDADNSNASFNGDLEAFANVTLPYEFMLPVVSPKTSPSHEYRALVEFQQWLRNSAQDGESYLSGLLHALMHSQEPGQPQFRQFEAPLSLLVRACQFNRTKITAAERVKHLYVAQSNLSHLPPGLSQDLPVPDLVLQAGRGDIYDSSVWLGLQPTYTPLHRDPNPNLFCQLVGSKSVRLMRPQLGSALYARVRRELGFAGNSRFRGSEMMDGPERELLHRAVWGEAEYPQTTQQAILAPGDVLFIPKGWWHSVVSVGEEAELNASVNWWFR